MKLKRSEKILVGVCGGLVAIAGLYFLLYAGDSRPDGALKDELAKLTGEVSNKKNFVDAANRDRTRLENWEKRSLPFDKALASSLYQTWLREVAAGAKLQDVKVGSHDQQAATARKYSQIKFDLAARASLSGIVDFLYRFYSSGYLHRINRLEIKPNRNTRDLDLTVSIETLLLQSAQSKDKLPTNIPKDAWHGLTMDDLSKYQKPIVARDFFTDYVAPPPTRMQPTVAISDPPKPPPKKLVDVAEHAYVSALVDVDGVPEIWLGDRIAGKNWELGAGDGFTVGARKGTVESINPDGEAVVRFDNRRRVLHLGDRLYDPKEAGAAAALPATTSTQSNQPDDQDDSDGNITDEGK